MLFILRGPSGSGKSTFANTLLIAGVVEQIFEADQFMTDEHGNYEHCRARLTFCHAECLRLTKAALALGDSVAVANTFTKKWEVEAYTQLNSNVTILTMEGRFQNVHGVPDDIVAHQRLRMERWWPSQGQAR